jgi:hypothetical protein
MPRMWRRINCGKYLPHVLASQPRREQYSSVSVTLYLSHTHTLLRARTTIVTDNNQALQLLVVLQKELCAHFLSLSFCMHGCTFNNSLELLPDPSQFIPKELCSLCRDTMRPNPRCWDCRRLRRGSEWWCVFSSHHLMSRIGRLTLDIDSVL